MHPDLFFLPNFQTKNSIDMKKGIFSTSLVLAFLASALAQDASVRFTVRVSPDSILMDNVFEVTFTLENAKGHHFEAPDFNEHFRVVSGPNSSTSMRIVNGEMSQTMTISYYLEPRDIGSYYILPASVEAAGKILETPPLEVLVVPNPTGIRQPLPQQHSSRQLDLNWGRSFDFDFDFPFGDWSRDFFLQPSTPNPQPKTEPKTDPQKKKKTIRI
jgi:hypothetical protein